MGKVSNNEETIRVLQIGMHDTIGGVEVFLMNYYRALNRKKVQFDFVNPYDKLCFEDEIKKMGGKIYKVSSFKKHPIKYYQELKKIIKDNYDIVHVNMLSAANILPILIASKLRVKHIIAHSHNNGIPKGLVRKILNNLNKKVLRKKATDFLACSESAGTWMFGDQEFKVINNCIDVEKFKYDKKIREKIRKKYNLENKFVIGHIGRFEEQKNHEYLVELFQELSERNDDCVLLLIGDGVLRTKILNKVDELGLTNKVIYVGNQEKPQDYYSAMDLFVLPSKFEGLGIVNVEAQASGLPCVVSNVVPEEVKLSPNFYRINLNDKDEWVNKIENIKNKKINREKNIALSNLDTYDLRKKSVLLEEFYFNLKNDKNILIITPGALPVPAYQGGAVENLIQSYLKYNEQNKKFNFYVYSISDDEKKEYKNSKFIKVKRNFIYKVSRVIRYIINNKLPFIYIGNVYTKKILNLLKKDSRKYDAIVVENTPFMGIGLKKIYKDTPIILHLHNDYLNVNTKRCKQILESYDKIISISQYIKSRIDEIMKNDKVVVVYNGVNIEIFKEAANNLTISKYREKYTLKKDDIVILYTGRLVKEKGLTELINACSKIIQDNKKIKGLHVSVDLFYCENCLQNTRNVL